MEQLFTQAISIMSAVPSPLVYLIAALWVGIESAGIGVPIEPDDADLLCAHFQPKSERREDGHRE